MRNKIGKKTFHHNTSIKNNNREIENMFEEKRENKTRA